MTLQEHISDIRQAIRNERFSNEAAVSQGIVLRLLQALGWPTYDIQVVFPEFGVGGRRVDFALCHPRNKPLVFIEVKQIGKGEGADRQLFEYAFHVGVPMAIMTEGQEWHFYLPGEQGRYEERRVYKLDILERDVEESAEYLTRYLSYEAMCSGQAIDLARKDYRNVSKERQIRSSLPTAWNKLIEEQDELLVELLADKVESLCGYKPTADQVASFLESRVKSDAPVEPIVMPQIRRRRQRKSQSPTIPTSSSTQQPTECGFVLYGDFYRARNAKDVLIQVMEELSKRDNMFLERFDALPKHGRKRRYIARTKGELYPGRPDLANEHSLHLASGWWLGTNYSKRSIERIIRMACEVAGIDFGKQLQLQLG